jgi:putative inorganic carbon (hco3(-)) transporter
MERLVFTGASETVRHRGAPSRQPAPVSSRIDQSPAGPAPRVRSARRGREPTDWAWRGLLLFTAVLFLRPQDQIKPLEIFHLAEVFALISIAGLVTGRLARRLPVSVFTPEIGGIIAFGLAMIASIPMSIWPGGSVNVLTDVGIKVFLIFVLLVNTLDRPERLDQLTFMMVVLSGYLSVLGVFDAVRGVHMVEGDRLRGPVGGMFDNPNDFALALVAVLPFALLWMFRDVPLWKRGIAAGSALAMMASIVFTRSRGGMLGLAAMIALLVVRSIRFKPSVAAATLVGVLAGLPLAPASFWDRMVSIVDADKDPTGSRQARIDLMKEAWQVYLEHPVVGIGLGQFVNYDPEDRVQAWRVTHNALLEVATELGTLGLVPFLYLLWRGATATRTARRLLLPAAPRRWRRRARSPAVLSKDDESLVATATALGPSLAGWFVSSFFASVALGWTIYYLLALAAATRDLAQARLAANDAPALARAS